MSARWFLHRNVALNCQIGWSSDRWWPDHGLSGCIHGGILVFILQPLHPLSWIHGLHCFLGGDCDRSGHRLLQPGRSERVLGLHLG